MRRALTWHRLYGSVPLDLADPEEVPPSGPEEEDDEPPYVPEPLCPPNPDLPTTPKPGTLKT